MMSLLKLIRFYPAFVLGLAVCVSFGCPHNSKSGNSIGQDPLSTERTKQTLTIPLIDSEKDSLAENRKKTSSLPIISIIDFGAKGDGETDATQSIQKAIDSAWKRRGGIVLIPKGVFLLSTKVGPNRSLITPRSNVEIRGEGPESILKVADGQNKYNIIFPPDDSENYGVENVKFSNFTVECNGENNIPNTKRNGNKGAAIGIRIGRNITIENVKVKNSASRQVFMFGNNTMPFSVTNVTIKNCIIENVGSSVLGNTHLDDHSTLHVQADTCYIANNQIVNPRFAKEATAIEIGGNNFVVENNYCYNFGKGMNIVASVTDLENVVIRHNDFIRIGRGIYFHSWLEGYRMTDVLIDSNTISQHNISVPIVDASRKVKSPIYNITFSNNVVKQTADNTTKMTPAILVGKVSGFKIVNNNFLNLSGPIISLGNIGNEVLSIQFENNLIENVKNKAADSLFILSSKHTIQKITITGNKFHGTAKGVIKTDARVEYETIGNNEFSKSTQPKVR